VIISLLIAVPLGTIAALRRRPCILNVQLGAAVVLLGHAGPRAPALLLSLRQLLVWKHLAPPRQKDQYDREQRERRKYAEEVLIGGKPGQG
jgi:hypothetical protein